jgi:hypothetical protein
MTTHQCFSRIARAQRLATSRSVHRGANDSHSLFGAHSGRDPVGSLAWRRRWRGTGTNRAAVHRYAVGANDCPTRFPDPAITKDDRISRFPSNVRPFMGGIFDCAGSQSVSPCRRLGCFRALNSTASAPRNNPPRGGAWISRLDSQPVRSSLNVSLSPLRTPMHDSGPGRVARPSIYKTFVHHTLPV